VLTAGLAVRQQVEQPLVDSHAASANQEMFLISMRPGLDGLFDNFLSGFTDKSWNCATVQVFALLSRSIPVQEDKRLG